MKLHVRKSVKSMIFILNLNPASLSFKEGWLFNMVSKQSIEFALEKTNFRRIFRNNIEESLGVFLKHQLQGHVGVTSPT